MRLKAFALLVLVISSCTGCSPKMTRYCYEKPDLQPRENCSVKFIEFQGGQEMPSGRKIGTLVMEDTGLGVHCDKATVLNTIKDDACRIGADEVVLKNMKNPGFSSSCYRVTAVLMQSAESLAVDYASSIPQEQPKPEKPPYPRTISAYGTFGYSAASMDNINEAIERNANTLAGGGDPPDWDTFDGGLDLNLGCTIRSWERFSFGADLSFQVMSVDNDYSDDNVDASEKLKLSIIDIEIARAEYWIPRLAGLHMGGFAGFAFGHNHIVTSFERQDPYAYSESELSFSTVGGSYGAFIGYQRRIISEWGILFRVGYRVRRLRDQMNFGIKYYDSLEREIENDFSGFYVIAGVAWEKRHD